MDETNFKLHYQGSILLLVFWFIVFFPIAFVLFFTGCTFTYNQSTYNLHYDGSRFWLCFWVLVFFPIAFILLIVNGLSIRIQRPIERYNGTTIEDDRL